eukprot:Trichotokara_eunicae@DN4118_c0_g1_i1.p1
MEYEYPLTSLAQGYNDIWRRPPDYDLSRDRPLDLQLGCVTSAVLRIVTAAKKNRWSRIVILNPLFADSTVDANGTLNNAEKEAAMLFCEELCFHLLETKPQEISRVFLCCGNDTLYDLYTVAVEEAKKSVEWWRVVAFEEIIAQKRNQNLASQLDSTFPMKMHGLSWDDVLRKQKKRPLNSFGIPFVAAGT